MSEPTRYDQMQIDFMHSNVAFGPSNLLMAWAMQTVSLCPKDVVDR